MKGCELCNGVARIYCESDQASLCWDCDGKVHCANFLVAKHCRCLLCQICQSPTQWIASGPKLGPTVSICESCFSLHDGKKEEIGEDRAESHAGDEREDDDYVDGDSDDYDDDDDGHEDEESEEEDGENQVVPWSVTSPSAPVASSSSSEEEISDRFSCGGGAAVKRMRENNAGFDSDDEIGCSSCHTGYGRLNNEEGNSLASIRPLKQARTGEVEDDGDHHHNQNNHNGQSESRSTAIIDSLKRLQGEMVINRENASETIIGICRLSRYNHSR